MLRFVLGFALVSCATLTGCKQGVGDRCQVMSDCDDGLICVLPNGGTAQAGGTCQPPGGVDGFSVDLATPLTGDAGPDLSTHD
jgi:hypothetical protein